MPRYRIDQATGQRIYLPMSAGDLTEESAAAVKTLRAHAQRVAAVIAQHQTRRAEILKDSSLSSVGKEQQITASKQQMEAASKALKQQRQEALDTLAAVHTRARAPQDDSAAHLLRFQQEEAAWRRAEKLRTAGQDWMQIVRAAGERGDTAMLSALRRELPAELAALDQRDPTYSKSLLKLIAEAEEPHVSDLERAVRQSEAQAEKLAASTIYNERVLDSAVENGPGEPIAHFLLGPDNDAIELADGMPRF